MDGSISADNSSRFDVPFVPETPSHKIGKRLSIKRRNTIDHFLGMIVVRRVVIPLELFVHQ